jgi:membrane dipeptidase
MADTTNLKTSHYGLIIDGLNCAVLSREQMERTRAGHVAGLNYSMMRPWFDFETSMIAVGRALNCIHEMSDLVAIALTAEDILQAQTEGRVALIMSAQNCAFIEKDLSLLRVLHGLGFRVLHPTYNESNKFGDGSTVSTDEGLTELGREWVHEMNRLGMVIDMSHCGYRTGADAIKESKQPVIFSHANALALCENPRNKPDELIRAIAERGGVTGAVCFTPFIKQERRSNLDDYLDQIDYIAKLAGIDHVSFASDWAEGVYTVEEWSRTFGPKGKYPSVTGGLGSWYTFEGRSLEGYESLAQTPRIWDGLLARGYSEGDVEKIMGRNLLRVFREVWGN